ncbi:MAG TPA: hypothetical protein PK431_07845 [Chitinophagales bacterium]|nr:hypothetical protein [Chitinophagales bacterium]
MKTKKILSILIVLIAISFSSCKKENNNNSTALETGNWNLQLWDGAPAVGTLVFTANTLDFNCSTYSFSETDTYTKSGSTYTFTKTGGASIVISAGNDWKMDTLTTNVLRMTSRLGLIVRATK